MTPAPSVTTPPPDEVIVSEDKGEGIPEPRMPVPARKDDVRVQAAVGAAPRRSSRSTKGQTSRYDGFELGDE